LAERRLKIPEELRGRYFMAGKEKTGKKTSTGKTTVKKKKSTASAKTTKNKKSTSAKKTSGRSNADARGKTLVLVESPTKAHTLKKMLGSKYLVKASMGHIRDLPKSRLAIDIDNDFEPEYIIVKGKAKLKNELVKLASTSSDVILAADPDREGEAIAWHLAEILNIDKKAPCRVRVYEITKQAVQDALKAREPIDINKVEAQQARRVLDRLVGYSVSPVLWKKIRYGLSAGRVQSVALSLICRREREIRDFVPVEYWVVTVNAHAEGDRKYSLRVESSNGKTLLKEGKPFLINCAEEAEKIASEIGSSDIIVKDYSVKESKRKALPPFKTSTMQQEAARRLHYSPRRTMRIAQSLFEGVEVPGMGLTGLITYMRTDSLRIAPEAISGIRKYLTDSFSKEYIPAKPNFYTSKQRTQDAHEAIRPTDVSLTPESIKNSLNRDQYRLYSLIWQRTVASQMAPAVVASGRIDAEAGAYGMRQTGTHLVFDGWSAIWPLDLKDTQLPKAEKGEKLDLVDIDKEQKFTKPPARYSEAKLIRTLEDKGVGRPSTYASIVETLYDRTYVERDENGKLMATPLGMTVDGFLIEHFDENSLSSIVDAEFTASMENNLDEVEEGKKNWVETVRLFWDSLTQTLKKAEEAPRVPLPDPEPIGEDCPECGEPLVKKRGRFGEFIGCSGYPNCRYTRPILDKTGVKCPKCGEKEGGEVVKRKTKKGRRRNFYGCSRYPDCDFISWDEPTGDTCPVCGAFMVKKGKNKKPVCSSCGYVMEDSPGNDADE
jgi:DNA topoisomerase-1